MLRQTLSVPALTNQPAAVLDQSTERDESMASASTRTVASEQMRACHLAYGPLVCASIVVRAELHRQALMYGTPILSFSILAREELEWALFGWFSSGSGSSCGTAYRKTYGGVLSSGHFEKSKAMRLEDMSDAEMQEMLDDMEIASKKACPNTCSSA
eukprot:6204792-Amphidinium_carterae.1